MKRYGKSSRGFLGGLMQGLSSKSKGIRSGQAKVRRNKQLAAPRDMTAVFNRRMTLLGLVGTGVGGVLAARMTQLQFFQEKEFQRKAVENFIRRELVPPTRGEILDRFGQPIATQRTTWRISVTPEQTRDLEGTLRTLFELAPLPIEDEADRKRREEELIVRLMNRSKRQARFIPLIVRDDIGSYELYVRIAFQAPRLEGVRAETLETRSYPDGEAFGHLIGYVAKANDAEQKKNAELAHPSMRLGKSGVEGANEAWLKGSPGEQPVMINAKGRVVGELTEGMTAGPVSFEEIVSALNPRPVMAGKPMVLTLDRELQLAAVERLRRTAKLPEEQSGAIVVIDIKTGDLLVFASDPAFDPNLFVNGYPSDAYRALTQDQRSPLFHKAYDGLYPPGSTFKMVVAAAGLRSGVIDPDDRVFCTGGYPFGGRIFHCWKRGGHGSVNLHQAMKVSCDTYFYEMARRTGSEAIAQAAREFGLGQHFDIGATGGRSGVVPDAEWKRRERGLPWLPGETLNFGIGQGALLTSPLQLAVMTARMVGNGDAITPKLMLMGPNGSYDAPTFERLKFSDEILRILRDAMVAVTSEPGGTAFANGDLGLGGPRQGGKTGTSQVRRITMAERAKGVIANEDLPWRSRDHALFVGFAPADAPRYAASVIIEHGGGGSKAAAPVAKDVLAAVLKKNPAEMTVYRPAELAHVHDGSCSQGCGGVPA